MATLADLMDLSTFERAYCECALWLMTDDKGELLDKNYVLEDIPMYGHYLEVLTSYLVLLY